MRHNKMEYMEAPEDVQLLGTYVWILHYVHGQASGKQRQA